MDEERLREHHAIPANIDDAVIEFTKARHDRIATRRARISEKIAAAEEAEGLAEIGSNTSSADPLDDDIKPKEDSILPKRLQKHAEKKSIFKKSDKEETKKPQRASEHLDRQIQESRRLLEQMILDGEVLITNVKVAAEYREKTRQAKEEESKKERLARLRQEAEECQEMYDTLSQNWQMKAEKALPMDLYKQLKAQQEACEELLAKKDDMIIYLRREVEENDFEYEGNLEKYQKDGMLMGDRIDDLVDDLRIAFIEELNLIEDYTCKDREVILEENHNEWLNLLQDFETMEQKNLEERKSDALAKFQILNDLYIATKQEARDMRHKMEDDLRLLFQEREQLKYACHLNLEKMAYNLHILQCRSKENCELKNMMKRLLLQLHEKMDLKAATLKKKMDMGTKHMDKLTKEIQRLDSQVLTFGQKTYQLATSDHKKFIDLWESNEELVKEKVKSLADSDKFIYETQLGIEYPMPDLTMFEIRPPEVNKSLKMKMSLAPEKKSSQSLRKSASNDEESTASIGNSETSIKQKEQEGNVPCVGTASLLIMPTPSLEFIPGPEPDPAIQRRLMKAIAKVICDQSGFIVEEELQKILSPLLETEQNLVNLDAVLDVLGITNVEEMQGLSRYMLKYCKVMQGVMSRMDSNMSAGLQEMNISLTNVVGKAAMLDGLVASEHSLNNLSSLDDTDSVECGVEPSTYCECKSAKAHARAEAEKKKKAKQVKVNRRKSRVDKREERLTVATSMQFIHVEQVPCDIVCCTPPSSNQDSLDKMIDELDSDTELAEALEAASEESAEEAGTPAGSENGIDCSLKTSKSTVLSWLESVDREKLIEDLNRYNEDIDKQCHEQAIAEELAEEAEAEEEEEQTEDDEGENEENDEEQEKNENEKQEKSVLAVEKEENDEEGEEDAQEEDEEELEDEESREQEELMCTKGPRPRRLTEEEKRDMEKEKAERERVPPSQSVAPAFDMEESEADSGHGIISDDETKTVSIVSFDSFTDASDEFLYIDPQDVVTALKNFIDDYNNKQKVVLPTHEEIIAKKLARIKYPALMVVAEYWEATIQILNPKGKDLWDTVQHCFEQYNQVLKERNEQVVEIEKYYKQNFELSHLLKKHFQGGSKCYSRNEMPSADVDPRDIKNYC